MRYFAILLLLFVAGCGRAPLSAGDEVRRVMFENSLELLHSSGLRGPHPICLATRFDRDARRKVIVEDPSAVLVRALNAAIR